MGGPKSDIVFDSHSPPPIFFQDLFREQAKTPFYLPAPVTPQKGPRP
jgi:hypothetical protein